MTTREFYVAIANNPSVSAELVEKASELIAKMDEKNAKRTSADSKQKRETAERRELVLSVLQHDRMMTADEVAEMTGLTVGQVRSALSIAVRGGIVVKTEVKVEKSKKMMYNLCMGDIED